MNDTKTLSQLLTQANYIKSPKESSSFFRVVHLSFSYAFLIGCLITVFHFSGATFLFHPFFNPVYLPFEPHPISPAVSSY